MNLKLKKLKRYAPRPGPLLLVIMDGIGIAPAGPANAVRLAKTPCLDRLFADCPVQTELKAHGPAVGLPSWEDMGNSEVGHNALGAGRIFDQGAKLVNQAIASGTLFSTALWQRLLHSAQGPRQTLHFIGLLSDGNVHSHIDHLFALLRQAAAGGVQRLAVHALLDGRDVAPKSALTYIERSETFFAQLHEEFGCEVFFASGGGRMAVTMDRYNADWQIVERGWHAHVLGEGRKFSSITAAVTTFYREDETVIDQYLPPFVVSDSAGKARAPIHDGDAVICFNFRGDRAIEITRAFEEADFKEFPRQRWPKVVYAGMMQYDGDLQLPKQYLVAPPQLGNPLSEYLCDAGVKSFAISETQKYGHVTYFWNGNRSGYINRLLEEYIEIPSDRIPFNQRPEMKAAEITAKCIELINDRKRRFEFGRINYPNGDMVGHTGDLQATIKAVEAVDHGVQQLIDAVTALQGITVILADHGNADEMFTEKNGVRVVKTSHTLNPVPFFIVDSLYKGEYSLANVQGAGLANVAATLLNLLGYEKPADYAPSLIAMKE